MKILLFAMLVLFVVSCKPKYNPEISAADIKNNIEYLASDSLKGRKPGKEGGKLAADFIRTKFKNAGLKLMFNNGYQKFKLVTSAEIGKGNSLTVNGKSFEVEKDFLPYAFSSNTKAEATVVFAGYGLQVNLDKAKWDDYKGVDVAGKWVLALQGDPDMENAESPFVPFSTERAKALNASDNKAAGLILVAGPSFSKTDNLPKLFFDKDVRRYSFPVIQVTREVANQMLAGTGETVTSLETKIVNEKAPVSLTANTKVTANVKVDLKEIETQNVVAEVPGNDPALKDQYIVVGAHYDHLGMGGPGSGSRMPDTIAVHNGADDNASGTASVIEMAEKMASEKNNKRSVIFVAFGAEEMGLLGSKAFTANPPVAIDKIVAMFNLDMVGRLDSASNALSVGGTKTAKETEDILNKLNPGFSLSFSGEGVGPSDHASFYLQDIPVIYLNTGAHADYHTPRDDAEFINFEGIKKVDDYCYALLTEVANRDNVLTFQEAGPKFKRSSGARYKVTLGIMPDFAGMEKRGLRVDAVTKGKPAFNGGMKKGDIIVAIEGKKVGGIHDYMSRLQSLEAGKIITVDVIRNNEHTVLLIQL